MLRASNEHGQNTFSEVDGMLYLFAIKRGRMNLTVSYHPKLREALDNACVYDARSHRLFPLKSMPSIDSCFI